MDNSCNTTKVKVRFKWHPLAFAAFLLGIFLQMDGVASNRAPRFLIDGQTEIVLRLKEGEETPIGTLIYKLRGVDADGDKLVFGVRQTPGSNVIRVESASATEANVYLNQELDRETRDEYALVLTLTDGHLGAGNFITQSLLLLVEDVNDNVPVFKPYQPSLTVPEDASPGILTSLEATDADEGAYGQVVYSLQDAEDNQQKFSVSTVSGKGVVRLIGDLDFEKQRVHQLKVLAVDRAKQGRVNTGTAAILIRVQDVEDKPPEFVRVQPVARIAENAAIGTSILQVTAVDGDREVNNPISYSLVSNGIDKESDLFRIERHTGIVYTTSSLDRESSASGSYILQITATEVGSKIRPPPNSVTEVTVMITDINDEKPRFRSGRYFCEIPENSPVNTPLTFLGNSINEVFDYDQGVNGTFQLFIGDHNDIFEVTPSKVINEANFLIRIKNSSALDYESNRTFNFTLVAREIVKNQPKRSEVPIIVSVLDRNDNYPEFSKPFYEVWVPENCKEGTTVAWVQALDEDSGNYGTDGVRYTNVAGSIADLLSLHPVSGVIKVKTAGGSNWDREQVGRHYLTVEARDDLGTGNRNTVQLIINIEDVNDNPPVFVQNKYEARLVENERDFEVALKVEARDIDLAETKNSEIEYSLIDNYLNFSIDPHTGQIRPSQPLDFERFKGPNSENVRILHLTVRAGDWGDPALYSEVPLTIYLIDANDHSPKFDRGVYNLTIPENIPGGTSIFQVKAHDGDGSVPNSHVVYRIQNGASDKFIIGSENGVISIARGASLDPDTTQPRTTLYSLHVVALDGATGENQKSANVTVNINILDVNNKAPSFIDPGTVTITENVSVGSVVTRVRANDMDAGAKLMYKIDANTCQAKNERGILLKKPEFDCESWFDLDEEIGLLRVAKLIDREMMESIVLTLIVEDIAAETDEPQIDITQLVIKVEDVNDNNPKFRKPYYRFSVTENSKNGVVIGSVIADDADKNKSLSYTLEGREDIVSLVYLDKDTGDLLVSNKIDHEMYDWLNLTIKATDSDVPSRSSRVELFIQILDENDNNPFFLPEPKSLAVAEDAPVGQKIATLEAKDSDSGEYGKITYLLDRISSQGKFSLDPDTGVLKVADILDRETKPNYLLVVEAWDNYQYGYNTGESRNAFKHINVTILDVNDNDPQLSLPSTCISITEFHEPGQVITTIQAHDADDPQTLNGQVVLDIAGGNKQELFVLQQINEFAAEIKTLSTLQGKHGNYSLILRAQDLGTPGHVTQGLMPICVTDFNDHAPEFLSPPHNSTLKVPENATVGSALVQIVAKDDDVGPNGAVRYRLKSDPAGHWKTFNLQPVSGILELRLPLDRSKQKIYDIRIEAYDLGVPTALSSDLDLTVYVSNINDYQPQFMVDEYLVNFTENKSTGLERRRMPETVDRDELEFDGPVSPICYFIVGGNDGGWFQLNALSHELTVTSPLDRETQDEHLLLVKATEDCLSPPNNLSFFDASDDTLLKVIIKVNDVNDNAPKFIHRVFTGGVSTVTSFGTKFMHVKALDPDDETNAEISYYLVGKIQMTLTEGLENLQRAPFIVEKETGSVQLNFDPQQGMKGYFDFMVLANDTGGLQDIARVFIYLLREDQRVRFVLRQQPVELRNRIEIFREILGNVTGAIVNVDEFRAHANHDGSVDKTRTDLYLHLVNRRDHSILEVAEVLRLVDQNTERLDALFKEFNVLDTQPGGTLALSVVQKAGTTFWLTASSLFLFLLLLLCLALCVNQRHTYQRKLKAATATAYDSEIDGRGISGLSGRVPNTNKHSMEGSNPMWLKAYENEWYKNSDDMSQNSEHDSLDENVLSSGDSSDPTLIRAQNVYQTLPPILPPRKMETTEL